MLKIVDRFFRQGHERTIKAKKNILAMIVIKGISVIVGLLLISVTISYVDATRYGIWLTLSSIIAWISFFDIGFGNGLKNKFAEALANGNIAIARVYVSTTYVALSLIAAAILIIFLLVNRFLDWSSILNAPENMSGELSILAIIVVITFLTQFVLKLITSLLYAIQKPALASLMDMLIQLFLLLSIVCLMKVSSQGSLLSLGLVTCIATITVLLLTSVYFFTGSLKKFAPSIKLVHYKYAKDLLNLGGKFFIVQIAVVVCYQSNNIIITQILGPQSVTVYNVAFKYLSIASMMFNILILPFWSAFTEAYVKKDSTWMLTMLRRLRMVWGGIVGCVGILLLISSYVYDIWIKDDGIIIPFAVTFGLSFYQIVNTWGMLYSTILNGLGKVKIQLISAIAVSIVNIPISILACRVWGLSGLIWIQVILMLISSAWWSPIQVNKVLKGRARGIWNE